MNRRRRTIACLVLLAALAGCGHDAEPPAQDDGEHCVQVESDFRTCSLPPGTAE